MAVRGIWLAGAALLGAGVVAATWRPPSDVHRFEPIAGCVATDGDTLQCGSERVRLMGIDAPEIAGHCRPKECATGDPAASQAELAAALGTPMVIQRWGTDRYGRTLGVVRVGTENIGCRQLRLGQAIYKPEWDQGDGVHADCPDLARR